MIQSNIFPLISIIVPVYNIEEFVGHCILSITNQSYKNLEIFIIDDGSTDQSGKICDDYATKDNRIRVFHKENGGLSDARNFGLDNVNGEFVSFIDGDDIVHRDFIKLLYQGIIESNADISMCELSFEDLPQENIEAEWETTDYDGFFKSTTSLTNRIVICNKLFKKELFKNLRFDIGRKHEDVFIFHKLFWAGKFAVSDVKLYYYRHREGSITKNITYESLNDRIEAFSQLTEFFRNRHELSFHVFFNELLYYHLIRFHTYHNAESRKFLKRNPLGIIKSNKLNLKEKVYLFLNLLKTK